MKQVILIGGGTTFSSYEKYLEYLQTKTVSIDRLMHNPSWKESLQKKLGNKYLVLQPSMPNKTNARYNEWALWFSRITEVIEENCVLVGHSLGGCFLVKYLSENTFPKKIRATILLAAPFDDESIEDLTDFKLHDISDLFRKQAGKTVFFAGTDDPVVPFHETQKYKKRLPDAEYIVTPAPDHFVRAEFPEIVAKIKEF